MRKTIAFKLGKLVGFMDKRLRSRGQRFHFDELMMSMHIRPRLNMAEMIKMFHLADECDFKTEFEIAKLLADIGEVPEQLLPKDRFSFTCGYYSNWESVGSKK